jgi:beta-mannosidase
MNVACERTQRRRMGVRHTFWRVIVGSAIALLMLASSAERASAQAPSRQPLQWTITLEEPTGIYRRDSEVVTVRMTFRPGEASAQRLSVVDSANRVVPTQISALETFADGSLKTAEILFPASIVPGDRPQYRLVTTDTPQTNDPRVSSSIVARRIGVGRIEMANSRFGVLLNLGLEGTEPAIVAAYNRTAGETRMLNLVDTTPDVSEDLAFGRKSSGFGTFLSNGDRKGSFDRVDILEQGPLRGRVRMSGAMLGGRRETWEFVWLANSPVLKWTASIDQTAPGSKLGFFLSCISATPYLPFDRWMEGVELKFPDGWETDNPPDHLIGGRDLADLPGGHIVYYQREDNYGALGIYEMDSALQWKGVGARQLYAITDLTNSKLSIEIAIAFPRWKGTESILEARKEYRVFRQPILSVPSQPVARSTGDQPLSQKSARLEARTLPLSALPAEASERPTMDLNGKWKLQDAEKSEGEKLGYFRADFNDAAWREVSVPGSVHTQIMAAPKYFTPEAEWISTREWWYRRSFTPPTQMSGQRLFLAFEATDYYADVYLNGELIGRHEGYIDPYEIEVTGKLDLAHENQLSIRVWTPISYYWRHRPYTIKGSYGAVDQKPDNITPVGITRPLRLVARGPQRIEDIAVDTRLNSNGSADVVVDISVDSSSETSGHVSLSLAPRNFTSQAAYELRGTIPLERGRSTQRLILHVEKPELWWTWDHGKPNLYSLKLAIGSEDQVSDERRLAVGIREIEHVDWKFYLNGKRMFIRGSNFYYHLFQSEVKRSDYERDFQLMRAMNINMLRLHCNFSNPEFYDLADELGILIWQDYLEAWYPEDRTFSLKAASLYDNHIRYVRNHPSIAIWATSDEESLENYRDLTKHLEPRLFENDPQRRPVQRSTGRYGDAHVYEGWYTGTVWAYAKMTEKFVSELGATALPNYESIVKFLPDAWPIKDHEDDWVFHKLQLMEAMRAWGEPGSMTLQEYIPQTQDYVARLFQLAIERMRRLKYEPAGGILHFHAIDLWPSVTMAAIDYYRQPTKAYTTVQRSFQMVLPSFAYDRDKWQSGERVSAALWVINDHFYEIPGVTVSWRVVDEKGRIAYRNEHRQRIDLAADSSRKLTDVEFPAAETGRYTLWATISDKNGRTISENSYEYRVVSGTAQPGGGLGVKENR